MKRLLFILVVLVGCTTVQLRDDNKRYQERFLESKGLHKIPYQPEGGLDPIECVRIDWSTKTFYPIPIEERYMMLIQGKGKSLAICNNKPQGYVYVM